MARTEILILSDIHGNSGALDEVLTRTHPHLLLFCGDGLRDLAYLPLPCPLYAVRGNCDHFSVSALGDVQEELTLTVDGMTLLLCHGHSYGVKSGLGRLILTAAQRGVDAVIFGHTHEPVEMTLRPENTKERFGISLEKPLYLFNPGSLGYAPHSFGTLTLQNGVPMFGHGQLDPK